MKKLYCIFECDLCGQLTGPNQNIHDFPPEGWLASIRDVKMTEDGTAR